jgi:hypothetical protein
VVEETVASADLVAAFESLRGHWQRLFEGAPGPGGERASTLDEINADLRTIGAAARLSEEAMPYVQTAFRLRLDEWRVPGVNLSAEILDAAEGVKGGFEMRLRTLRQMESGDEILPDSGREIRRSAARDVCFFYKLRQLLSDKDAEKSSTLKEADLSRLSQCFDGRRRLVREEVAVPSYAVEAVEFLIRLGASG